MNTIEISYLVLFAIVIVTMILTVTRKMSMGIGLTGIGAGLLIVWLLSPYVNIIISPMSNALFYGGIWDIPAILGLLHIISMIFISLVAVYNLMASGGKIIWA